MTNLIKLATVSTLALSLSACASTDDKYQVGVQDDDSYSVANSDTDANLSDAQQFGFDDEDQYKTTTSQERRTEMNRQDVAGKMAKGESYTMLGGEKMYPSKTIVENARAATSLTTLVALVKQAEMVDTLSNPGPFTVFAPTDVAFSMVPQSTRTALMQDSNRDKLQNVLKYHVVSGNIMASDLMSKIESNGGSYTATTVAGSPLTFYVMDGKVKIADAKGNLSTVTTADVKQSNGVVHVVNSVLMPG